MNDYPKKVQQFNARITALFHSLRYVANMDEERRVVEEIETLIKARNSLLDKINVEK